MSEAEKLEPSTEHSRASDYLNIYDLSNHHGFFYQDMPKQNDGPPIYNSADGQLVVPLLEMALDDKDHGGIVIGEFDSKFQKALIETIISRLDEILADNNNFNTGSNKPVTSTSIMENYLFHKDPRAQSLAWRKAYEDYISAQGIAGEVEEFLRQENGNE